MRSYMSNTKGTVSFAGASNTQVQTEAPELICWHADLRCFDPFFFSKNLKRIFCERSQVFINLGDNIRLDNEVRLVD